MALYRESSTSADERNLISRIDEISDTFVRSGGEVMTLTDAVSTRLEEFEQDLWEIDAILDDRIQPLIHAETLRAAADAQASTAAAALTLLILGAIALLVGSGSAWALSRGILAPVRALVSGTEIIGEGTLTHRIGIASKDEFGQLAESFNRMVEKLQGALESVEEARATSNKGSRSAAGNCSASWPSTSGRRRRCRGARSGSATSPKPPRTGSGRPGRIIVSHTSPSGSSRRCRSRPRPSSAAPGGI